jgi:hypothetical protein
MNLEDKILGEKLHYYCSSSEDEGGNSGDENEEVEGQSGNQAAAASAEPQTLSNDACHWSGNSANTGPKGCI